MKNIKSDHISHLANMKLNRFNENIIFYLTYAEMKTSFRKNLYPFTFKCMLYRLLSNNYRKFLNAKY